MSCITVLHGNRQCLFPSCSTAPSSETNSLGTPAARDIGAHVRFVSALIMWIICDCDVTQTQPPKPAKWLHPDMSGVQVNAHREQLGTEEADRGGSAGAARPLIREP